MGLSKDQLVTEILGRIADKWTLVIIDELGDQTLRFSALQRKIGKISQKMLTQTLREMEKDGLVERTVHPEVPPRVEYRLTKIGYQLGEAVCGIWRWAAKHCREVERSRAKVEARARARRAGSDSAATPPVPSTGSPDSA
jgi:DNA-binding HxlR family transcriptional regulator